MSNTLSSLSKNVCQRSQTELCPSVSSAVGLLSQPTLLQQILHLKLPRGLYSQAPPLSADCQGDCSSDLSTSTVQLRFTQNVIIVAHTRLDGFFTHFTIHLSSEKWWKMPSSVQFSSNHFHRGRPWLIFPSIWSFKYSLSHNNSYICSATGYTNQLIV